MPRFDEHNYDELIKESERILRDVVAPGAVQTQADSEAAQARQELASLRATESESADGYVEVRLSEDRMMTVASFYPPIGARKPIELIEVQELLIAKGLRLGIDREKLKSSILCCNTSRRANCGVEVARGRRPSDEISPRLEIEASLLRREAPENPAAQTVDFRAISPFRFVKKGDTLAWITPRIKGMTGIDVTGAVVAYGNSSAHSPKPGKNTQVDEGVVVAQCDGRFVASDSSFWVSEVLQIRGDVDFSTGHIDTVKVGGSVRAKFIENCYVEAGGDVFVSTGCLNSVINTLGAVSMGPKGVIIGGKLNAQKGVSAFQIGSNAEVRTEIYCGMDYTVQKKLTWIRDRNIELALKLKKIEATLASRQNPLLLKLRDKLKVAIRKMNDSAKTLIASLDKTFGVIFPERLGRV